MLSDISPAKKTSCYGKQLKGINSHFSDLDFSRNIVALDTQRPHFPQVWFLLSVLRSLLPWQPGPPEVMQHPQDLPHRARPQALGNFLLTRHLAWRGSTVPAQQGKEKVRGKLFRLCALSDLRQVSCTVLKWREKIWLPKGFSSAGVRMEELHRGDTWRRRLRRGRMVEALPPLFSAEVISETSKLR